MTAPRWESIDSDTADLLTLVADTDHPSVDHEWQLYVEALRQSAAAYSDAIVDPNVLRPLVRGRIAPKRLGAFAHRAKCLGLIEDAGWTISDDTEGRNAGRPAKTYRWLGGGA